LCGNVPKCAKLDPSSQFGLAEKGGKMSGTPILALVGGGHLLGMVAGATTVPSYLLMENDEFVSILESATTLEEITEWVNENF
jgi:hypothetical protein